MPITSVPLSGTGTEKKKLCREEKDCHKFLFTPSECRCHLTLCLVIGGFSRGVSHPLKFWTTTAGAK